MKYIYLTLLFCLLAFIDLKAESVNLNKYKVYKNYSVHTELSWRRETSEVSRVHHVTFEEALHIAENTPNVTHFFYVNHPFVEGYQGFDYATDTIFFEAGDAVFFTGDEIRLRKLKSKESYDRNKESYAVTYVKKLSTLTRDCAQISLTD